ncbi:MAG TPA: NAD(P)-dependent oxidoreductase [Acidimicrobiia bacterium]|nr:NAD(P)-dependent oxidoreductase [Acidimicrobiia bacterium]
MEHTVDSGPEGRDGDLPDGPVDVAVLIPPEWMGSSYDAALAQIEAVDPRVRVVAEAYSEPHELRSERGTPGISRERLAALRAQTPALTDAQLAAFARMQVALAIDLPFDVATVAPRLRWVQAVGAGTAQLQTAGLGAAGALLTSAAGVNAVGIAEFVMARVLGHWKHIEALADAQRRHAWEPTYGRQLAGSTIGLIGLGEINAAVASRFRAFDVRVLATRRSATPGATAPNVDTVFAPTDLHVMLAACDAVVAAVPETPETIGVMDAAAFAAMPARSFFCNVGRGSFVDEPALIDALARGHLGGAALDVASVEPLPATDPLWDAPNLVLSPHSAASPSAMFANLFDRFAENLRRYLTGEPLDHQVDLDRGY